MMSLQIENLPLIVLKLQALASRRSSDWVLYRNNMMQSKGNMSEMNKVASVFVVLVMTV